METGGRAVGPLTAHLRTLSPSRENATDRYRIVEALGDIGDARAVDALLECVSDNHELPGTNEIYRIGSLAAEVLGRIGDPRAVEPLLKVLNDNRVIWDKRYRVALALGHISDPRVVPALRKVMRDPDPRVSRAARDALLEIGAIKPPWTTRLRERFSRLFR